MFKRIFLFGLINIITSVSYSQIQKIPLSMLETNGAEAGKVVGFNGTNIDWIVGGGSSSGGMDTNTLISDDIEVIGVTVGNYTNGSVIASNTTLRQFIQTMLQQRIAPTYTNPTLTLAYSGSLAVEAGTSLTPTLTPSWTQHDAGSLTNYELYENSVVVFSSNTASAFTQTAYTIGDETYTYYGKAYYGEGATKNDNFGDPDPIGKITAGTLNSSTRIYRGQRKYWYDADTSTNGSPNSAEIRALTSSALNAANGTTFSISIASGTTRVIFAYPKTLQAVTSVKYVELGNAEVKDTFTETEVTVEGASGYAGIAYRIYIYIPAVAFGDTATYNITI